MEDTYSGTHSVLWLLAHYRICRMCAELIKQSLHELCCLFCFMHSTVNLSVLLQSADDIFGWIASCHAEQSVQACASEQSFFFVSVVCLYMYIYTTSDMLTYRGEDPTPLGITTKVFITMGEAQV